MKTKTALFFLSLLTAFFVEKSVLLAQSGPCVYPSECFNAIYPGIPFLLWPNAKSLAMGGGGIASNPDVTVMSLNSSNLAFAESRFGISQTHFDVFGALFDEVILTYDIAGYAQLGDKNVIAASFRHIQLGRIRIPLAEEETIKLFELVGTLSYNRRLSDNFAAGLSVKYIHLAQHLDFIELEGRFIIKPVRSVATDISCTYQKPFQLGNEKGKFVLGLAMSNVGPKLHYNKGENSPKSLFLPTNLGIGLGLIMPFSENHGLTLALDLNRLLVPTPSPLNAKGDPNIPDYQERTFLEGMWHSFNDAPRGLREDWNENQYAVGVEYHYKFIYFRHGYMIAHETKGNTMMCNGLGLRIAGFGIDLSYILPIKQFLEMAGPFSITISSDLGTSKK